jgi:hypothetical protein
MQPIYLDADLSNKLAQLAQPIELCDPNGRIVGRFIPLPDISEWEPITPGVSDDEIERRMRSDERRYSTQEVLNHLRSL